MVKNYIDSINMRSLFRRLLLLVPTLFLLNFGIGCYYACGLGTDPISVFVDGQHVIMNMSYGQVTTINNVVLLVLMLFLGRKYMGIGTVVSCFVTGPLIDLFETMLRTAWPAATSPLGVKIALLAGGVLAFGAGLGFFVVTGLGIGPFDFLALWLRDVTKLELKWTRILFDALFLAAGWLLGGVVGVGTAAGVLLTGPVMSYTIKLIERPLGNFFGPLRKAEK